MAGKKLLVTNCSNQETTGVRPQMLCLPGLRSPLKAGESAIFREEEMPEAFIEDGKKFGQKGFFIKVEEYTPKRPEAVPQQAPLKAAPQATAAQPQVASPKAEVSEEATKQSEEKVVKTEAKK